jgi:hypothetical protein
MPTSGPASPSCIGSTRTTRRGSYSGCSRTPTCTWLASILRGLAHRSARCVARQSGAACRALANVGGKGSSRPRPHFGVTRRLGSAILRRGIGAAGSRSQRSQHPPVVAVSLREERVHTPQSHEGILSRMPRAYRRYDRALTPRPDRPGDRPSPSGPRRRGSVGRICRRSRPSSRSPPLDAGRRAPARAATR